MITGDAVVFLMRPVVRFWNKAPFIRLLLPLVAGIIMQWYLPFNFDLLLIVMMACIFAIVLYFFLSLKIRFSFTLIHGLLVNLMMFCAGCILIWINDIRNDINWFGNHYKNESIVVAKLEEPVIEKPNSYKALATIQYIVGNSTNKTVEGKIIIYFQKDSSLKYLNYGTRISFKKTLQEIKNSGNPGSFDYKTYSLFNGITHQVYLTKKDFVPLAEKDISFFKAFIFDCRHWVLKTIKKYIPQKKEQGLAEALLIGYKDDLDKNLVQSYSNTGVVHVIAISGLHLGLIYWLLIMLTSSLAKNKKASFIRLLVIILCIGWFSILAGAQPSVLRSAVMFSFLAAGEVLSRRTSIYNTLALSAFFLLFYNPFWLWDVGFQLSYTAVISIVAFFRPIYNWLYCKNKLLDMVWKLNAVTISAQLLTLPISMYHFHQVPTLFLFTNLVAVPLSSVILFGEIALCIFY
ncbi:MAG: ComEC/Rec2 family competence protein, partial [Flavisolibacter sp.]